MHRLRERLTDLGGMLVALCVLLGGGAIAAAQDAPPAGAMTAHPAHIHTGTCAEIGDVVFPLANVEALGSAGAPSTGTPVAASPTAAGSATGVETSFTQVDASLDELAAGGYAINVHESEANTGTYIACGEIGGTIAQGPASGEGRQLAIALRELNASGHSGVAVLREAGGGTEVTVYLIRGAAEGTPAVAGSGQADATATVTVEIRDFAYGPDTVTIPVGGTVTWTNQDAAPHTATARDREILQSGTLEPGESYSQTFDTPGTYEYFCEFHANMKGIVVVR